MAKIERTPEQICREINGTAIHNRNYVGAFLEYTQRWGGSTVPPAEAKQGIVELIENSSQIDEWQIQPTADNLGMMANITRKLLRASAIENNERVNHFMKSIDAHLEQLQNSQMSRRPLRREGYSESRHLGGGFQVY